MLLAKNSSGKIIATIIITKNKIYIDNYNKPMLLIDDLNLINNIKNKNEKEVIPILYDQYTLHIGEISALLGQSYFSINKKILLLYKNNILKTKSKEGRRNSSYKKIFSQERKNKIGEKSKGRKIIPYKRTLEIKEKISKTLKKGYEEGRININKNKISQAWADGRYSNSKIGRGIQGYFHSEKNGKNNNKDIYFRSLLELNFLIKIEENKNIFKIIMEPFSLKIDSHSYYLPDCLINDKFLIELKSKNHLKYTKDNINNRFEKEIKTAQDYCQKNDLEFLIIYDEDLNFETNKFKKFLKNNPEIIEKYNIRFNKEIY